MPVPNYMLLKRAQVILLVFACALMMCCKNKIADKNKKIVENTYMDTIFNIRDTIQTSGRLDYAFRALFNDMLDTSFYDVSNLRNYGIVAIKPIVRIDTFWEAPNEYYTHRFYLEDGTSSIDPYDIGLSMLIYADSINKKIKNDPSYIFMRCNLVNNKTYDTIINHILVHYRQGDEHYNAIFECDDIK